MKKNLKRLIGEYRLFLAYYFYLWMHDFESAEHVADMSDDDLVAMCLMRSTDEIIKFLREHLPNFDKEIKNEKETS